MNLVHTAQNLVIALQRMEGAEGRGVVVDSPETQCEGLWRRLVLSDARQEPEAVVQGVMSAIRSDPTFPLAPFCAQLMTVSAVRLSLQYEVEMATREHIGSTATAAYEAAGAILLALPAMEQLVDRKIIIRSGGVGGAVSIRFRNIVYRRSEAGIAALGLVPLFSGANPFVVAAGILVSLLRLGQAMTHAIPERESTVYWGVLTASESTHSIALDDIAATTNRERNLFGLPALQEGEILAALSCLAEWRAIRGNDASGWEVCESFRLKS